MPCRWYAAGFLRLLESAASLPSLAGGLSWDLDYTPTSLLLSVVSGGAISADFDGDGEVDAADLMKWKTGFGKVAAAVRGDGDAEQQGSVQRGR